MTKNIINPQHPNVQMMYKGVATDSLSYAVSAAQAAIEE